MTDRKSKVSVIIPIYNAQDCLETAVSSILNNSFQDIEVILIDDGSEDETAKICRDLMEKDSRIRFIPQEHKGVGAARNNGIKVSEGEYIAFIDADDYVSEDYLETLVRRADDNDLDWIVCGNKIVHVEGQKEQIKNPPLAFAEDIIIKNGDLEELPAAVLYGSAWGNLPSNVMGLYRRDMIVENELRIPEDIIYGEDMVFNYSVAHFVRSFGYITKRMYWYVQHGVSSSHQIFRSNLMDEEMKLIEAIETLRINHGDPLTWSHLVFTVIQLRMILIVGIFDIKDRRTRMEEYRRLKKHLAEEPMAGLWEQIKLRYRGEPGLRRLFVYLMKREAFRLMDTMRGLFKKYLP